MRFRDAAQRPQAPGIRFGDVVPPEATSKVSLTQDLTFPASGLWLARGDRLPALLKGDGDAFVWARGIKILLRAGQFAVEV
jgi:hypothetical protein